jgi:hypothetical protein
MAQVAFDSIFDALLAAYEFAVVVYSERQQDGRGCSLALDFSRPLGTTVSRFVVGADIECPTVAALGLCSQCPSNPHSDHHIGWSGLNRLSSDSRPECTS